jgi:uncharacterized protein
LTTDLTPHQRAVADAYIAERERERRHLVVYLSGAHAYGFPSPDSDLDIKCVHVAPTASLVGLDVVHDPPTKITIVDGVELDYGSNELAPVLRGAIKGNGNYLERLLGELVLGGDLALLAEARAVVRPLLSRRISRHYAGFAASQLRAFDEKPTAKRALYVLRTTATGRHLLATGELVTDLTRLRALAPPELDELLAIKLRGEQTPLPPEQAAALRDQLVAAIEAVGAAWPTSVLPPEPPPEAIAAVDAWLRDVRRRSW